MKNIIVSITGTLESMQRSEAAKLINEKTNATFNKGVTLETNYLVATDFTSSKAKKAAKYGVDIINEKELLEFINSGEFPQNLKPIKPIRENKNLLNWKKDTIYYDLVDPIIIHFRYSDIKNEVSERMIILEALGVYKESYYFAGFNEGEYKTFRHDRMKILDAFYVKANSTVIIQNNKISFLVKNENDDLKTIEINI
ncbi:BRCT domain-containing protein [Alphaproteobacteria bacterium]|nr:BRCT domain-containing protein [Alphaproteobacteria bacterium]